MFKDNPHYLEAFFGSREKPIFLGHLSDVGIYRDDVKDNNAASPHLGNIFCPERDADGFTYEKNMAWILGGIKSGRKFLLVSDLNHYTGSVNHKIRLANRLQVTKDKVVDKKGKDLALENVGVTLDEIRWLYDFGYHFVATSESKGFLAVPPEIPVEREMVPYNGIKGPTCDKFAATELKKLQAMLNDINKQIFQSQPKIAPAARSTVDQLYLGPSKLPTPTFGSVSSTSTASFSSSSSWRSVNKSASPAEDTSRSNSSNWRADCKLQSPQDDSQSKDEDGWTTIKKKGSKKPSFFTTSTTSSNSSSSSSQSSAGKKPASQW